MRWDSQVAIKVLTEHQFVDSGSLCSCGRDVRSAEFMAVHQAAAIKVALFKAEERRARQKEYAAAGSVSSTPTE